MDAAKINGFSLVLGFALLQISAGALGAQSIWVEMAAPKSFTVEATYVNFTGLYSSDLNGIVISPAQGFYFLEHSTLRIEIPLVYARYSHHRTHHSGSEVDNGNIVLTWTIMEPEANTWFDFGLSLPVSSFSRENRHAGLIAGGGYLDRLNLFVSEKIVVSGKLNYSGSAQNSHIFKICFGPELGMPSSDSNIDPVMAFHFSGLIGYRWQRISAMTGASTLFFFGDGRAPLTGTNWQWNTAVNFKMAKLHPGIHFRMSIQPENYSDGRTDFVVGLHSSFDLNQ